VSLSFGIGSGVKRHAALLNSYEVAWPNLSPDPTMQGDRGKPTDCFSWIWGQVVQDLNEISFRKNVVIDMDLDATLARQVEVFNTYRLLDRSVSHLGYVAKLTSLEWF